MRGLVKRAATVFGASIALMLSIQAAPASAVPQGYAVAITNEYSNQCLEVADWSQNWGAEVRQWPCTGGANQRWVIQKADGAGRLKIVNVNSGLCLDVPGADWSNGNKLVQWPCSGGINQSWWVFSKSGQDQDGITFFAGDVRQNSVIEINDFSTANGTRAQLWDYNGGMNQLWAVG